MIDGSCGWPNLPAAASIRSEAPQIPLAPSPSIGYASLVTPAEQKKKPRGGTRGFRLMRSALTGTGSI